MRSRRPVISLLAVISVVVAAFGAPEAAWAEHWSGGGDVCMDLDSVRIITNNGTRYVAFRQQLCKGSGILWWAVADNDCTTLRGKDADTVELYVYDADARQWRTADEFFNFPSLHEDEHANAGVACNWAHPHLP